MKILFNSIFDLLKIKFLVFICFIITLFLSFNVFPQQGGAEIGALAGGSYYMGDINLAKHFYSPHLNAGIFAKYHFNSRYVLRFSGLYTELSAADADFTNDFQLSRNRDFETMLIELAMQFEVHFLPYELCEMKRRSFTPYIQTGLAVYFASSSQSTFGLALPIGFGIKKNINSHLVIGAEWSFRKTFTDNLDSLSGEDLDVYNPNYGTPLSEANMHRQIGFLYNKDWYSLASITLSYTFKLGGLGCPAYYIY
ncbi:MAG TPA: DUF6089 family protein [Bacteroidales bacterium]|nr:DUF6089 family protein [Bacteroidales bacterium]